MKILLADPSKVWCQALEEQLKGHYQVFTATDGADVIPLLLDRKPDLLVLNLNLSHMDGLTILRTVYSSNIQVRVLVLADLFNDYVLGVLAKFKIAHALLKPCAICTVLTQIYEIMHLEEQESDMLAPEPALLTLGLRMNLSGFRCLCTAICLMRKNPYQGLTKELYPDVAKICGGTTQRVERAIRNVIHDAWLRRDERIWRAYFPMNREGRISLPSNGDFIVRIALGGKDNKACS
ncbi:MAG: response regulator [Oscillospiraceae bacterium]|nr:response regulator [Oscillospiraceae bacterium]